MNVTMIGIDVSKWQGLINFAKAKEAGIEFVIIKAGGSDNGFYTDKMFLENYKNAVKAGLHVGCYYFVGKNFITTEDGVTDAKMFEKIIKGKKFSMPIYLDLEATSSKNKKGATDASIAFCDYLESKGYYVGIYASDISGFRDKLDISRLKRYDKWVARYGVTPSYLKEYGMYQFSETGTISGIKGNCDLDYAYKNYPEIMKKAKKNGY